MAQSGIIEWFQCKGCGRRHRWQADLAGKEVECACGDWVACPIPEGVRINPNRRLTIDALDGPLSMDEDLDAPVPGSMNDSGSGSMSGTATSVGTQVDLDAHASVFGGVSGRATQQTIEIDGEDAPRGQVPKMRTAQGMWGMTLFAELCVWFGVSLLGCALIAQAAFLQDWWWIASAAIVAPLAFFKLHRRYKQWRGIRTFVVALDEELGD